MASNRKQMADPPTQPPAAQAKAPAADAPPEAPAAGRPRVWLVLGDKGGDNGQAEAVAKALGWPCERKSLRMRAPFVLGKPRVAAALDHIDLERSDPLEPPWPDLVLTIGRRPSSVALWIREQSGGRTKIVLIGKPSGPIAWFDLVVASAENAMPPLPNVVPVTLPLMAIDAEAIAAAGAAWQDRFADLPRPLIAVLVGGSTGQVAFDRAVVDRVIAAIHEVSRQTGGTVCVTTSRRTPESAVSRLAASLPAGGRLFPWTPEAGENPYHGLLALADGFVVTGDSISMMVEVVRARKPLAILPIPVRGVGRVDQWRRAWIRALFADRGHGWRRHLRQAMARLLHRLGVATQTRDFLAFHRLLVERGLAAPLGRGFPPPKGEVPDDLPKVVAAIKALFR